MLSRYVVSQVKHNSYFLVGLFLGLWLALTVVPLEELPQPCTISEGSTAPLNDEFEPQREEKPSSVGRAAGRSLQRPRYYSTELGMRGSLLAGALSSEAALGTRVAALNRTAAHLQPALRFFITASALQAASGLANVVGFTDTREMLKPFHALKYLADNYLEEYDFFFLVSDTAFVNARRLTDLVSRLSTSQDTYMGVVTEDDSHYCSLESGILLSNSVLKAVHNELDWCVRNSYSPHHHENLGRCVLHAAHLSCMSSLQGENYVSVRLDSEDVAAGLTPSLADAVTAHPVTESEHFYQLHAYVSRVFLERDRDEVANLRGYVSRNTRRHPPGYRNATWPGGLRADPGLAPPLPDNRFDHLRWTTFNATHAFMPDDHRAVAPLTGATKKAVDLVVESARWWALEHWSGASEAALVEGAWRWEPAVALRYRLLLRLIATGEATHSVRQLEVVRPLGAARLVPVPYVTESARVTAVLPLAAHAQAARDALDHLRRHEAVCLERDRNTALIVVIVRGPNDDTSVMDPVREAVSTLSNKYRGTQIELLEATLAQDVAGASETELQERVGRAAMGVALQRVSRDALILLTIPHMEFNEDFLNRVRMNTISGEQWYLPSGFARFAQYSHPRFVDASGHKPQVNTGRFNLKHQQVLSFYRRDYDSALTEWTTAEGAKEASIATVLARSPLRCIHASEPGLVLAPRPPPCGLLTPSPDARCLHRIRDGGFQELDLGARHALAKLLLETQADM